MSSPVQLSTTSTLTSSDQIILYSTINGSTRRASLATFLGWIETAWMSPAYQRVTASPTLSGFTLQLPDTANALFVLLTPTGAMATGTIVLPSVSSVADGQEIIIYTSQNVTALSFTLNGATAINGAPPGLGAGESMTLRYDALSVAWYTIEKPSTTGVTSGTFTPVYNGAGVTGTVTFSARYQKTGNVVSLEVTIVSAAASSLTWTYATDYLSSIPAAVTPSVDVSVGSYVVDSLFLSVIKAGGAASLRFSKAGVPTFTLGAGQTIRAQVTYLI